MIASMMKISTHSCLQKATSAEVLHVRAPQRQLMSLQFPAWLVARVTSVREIRRQQKATSAEVLHVRAPQS